MVFFIIQWVACPLKGLEVQQGGIDLKLFKFLQIPNIYYDEY